MVISFRYFSIPTVILTLYKSEPLEYKSGLMFKELSLARPSYNGFKLVYRTNLTEIFEIGKRVKEGGKMIRDLCIRWEGVHPCFEWGTYFDKMAQSIYIKL